MRACVILSVPFSRGILPPSHNSLIISPLEFELDRSAAGQQVAPAPAPAAASSADDITAALVSFRYSIPAFAGDNSIPSDQWVPGGVDPCLWQYVDCSNGSVVGLTFVNVPLQGMRQ